jgi:hypothetical protein
MKLPEITVKAQGESRQQTPHLLLMTYFFNLPMDFNDCAYRSSQGSALAIEIHVGRTREFQSKLAVDQEI